MPAASLASSVSPAWAEGAASRARNNQAKHARRITATPFQGVLCDVHESAAQRPLPARPAGEVVRRLAGIARPLVPDPRRLARRVKQFRRYLANELLHLPGEPAGVEISTASLPSSSPSAPSD